MRYVLKRTTKFFYSYIRFFYSVVSSAEINTKQLPRKKMQTFILFIRSFSMFFITKQFPEHRNRLVLNLYIFLILTFSYRLFQLDKTGPSYSTSNYYDDYGDETTTTTSRVVRRRCHRRCSPLSANFPKRYCNCLRNMPFDQRRNLLD